MQVDCPETSLLVTEPYFNLPNIAETYDQMIFEEWEFASYFRCTRALIASLQLFSVELTPSRRTHTVWRAIRYGRSKSPSSTSLLYPRGHRVLVHPRRAPQRRPSHLGTRQEVNSTPYRWHR